MRSPLSSTFYNPNLNGATYTVEFDDFDSIDVRLPNGEIAGAQLHSAIFFREHEAITDRDFAEDEARHSADATSEPM